MACFARTQLGALLAVPLLGCAVPGAGHPAQRCEQQSQCPPELVCHAGFCVAPDLEGQLTPDDFASDAGNSGRDAGSVRGDGGASDSPGEDAPPDEDDTGGAAPADTVDADVDDSPTSSPPLPSDQPDAVVAEEPMSCWWGPCCKPGLTLCGDTCVDVLTALTHCGKCERTCEPGLLCLGGECCGEGELLCDGRCVNPQKDKHNCGSCGLECEHGPCKDGMCRRDP